MKFIFLDFILSILVLSQIERSLADISTTIALSIDSGKISIWDWSTNNFSFVFNIILRNSLIFLKDGRLAGQVDASNVNIWNVTSGTVDLTLSCTGFMFEELSNGWFVAGDVDINVWNISSGITLIKNIPGLDVTSLKELSTSKLLAVGGYYGDLYIYDPANNFALNKTFTAHTENVWIIEELPNGNIITCSGDQTAKIWNLTQTAFLSVVNPYSNSIYTLKLISPDTLILGGISNSIYVYKINSAGQFVFNTTLPVSPASKVYDIKVTNTNLVMVSLNNGLMQFYNRTDMTFIKSYPVNVKVQTYAVYFAISNMYHYNDEKSIPTVENKPDKSIWKQFNVVVDKSMGQSTAIGSSFQTTNRLKCLIACANNPSCRAVTFDNNNNCTMFSAYPPSNGQPLISSIGTNLYYKF